MPVQSDSPRHPIRSCPQPVGWPLVATLLLALGLTGCWEDTPEEARFGEEGSGGGDAGSGGAGGGAGDACEADAARCDEDGRPERCVDGAWEAQDQCADGETCRDGACSSDPICEPGDSRCRNEDTVEICNETGLAWEPTSCEGRCQQGLGIAQCDDAVCVPGERTCNGDQVVVACTEDGARFEFVERCDGARTGKECDRGECTPICELNAKTKTNVGCDYWAVDLDNAFVPGGERGFLDAAAAPFAVVVSNPHPEFTATVTITNNEEQVDGAVVPPLGLHVFLLPRRDVDGSVLAARAYRVQSSIPIVAYQFNPLDNEEVFSNDASLLLPSHVLGEQYYIMTREQSFERLRGYLTVVGINDEPTTVRVQVTAPTRPGVGGIPALSPGETFEATLGPYDVLNIETNAPGADLTGSTVVATQDVVVFGGSEAANAPNTNHCVEIDEVTGEGVCEYKRDVPCQTNYDCNDARLNTCCADHLEQQLFPVDTWGTHYIATKSFDRGLENDYWRILAAQDNTKIETIPPVAEIPTLNAGEWYEFGSREHFEIVSDKPILVGQFLASEQAPDPNLRDFLEEGDAGTGDPAFILAVPVSQYRQDFVFLAPDKYALDYVSIIAPVGAEVFFDERPVPVSWEPVGDGAMWHIARFPIADGVHFIQSDVPLSVIVYGYDQFVSYGYPGGLNLDVVDPETGMGMNPPGGGADAGVEPPPDAGVEPAGDAAVAPAPDAAPQQVDAAAEPTPDAAAMAEADAALPAPDAAPAAPDAAE